jgi:UDP-glucose 4-epimerase
VSDLAQAHLAALARLETHGACRYNIGSGNGASVRDVIAAVERVGGRPVPHGIGPRREGDPAVLVAASDRLRAETGWVPQLGSLDDIVRTAWAWRAAHPHGYGDRQG